MNRTLTETQIKAVQFAKEVAIMAEADLGRNAGDGPKARPAVAQINRTLERLQSIEKLLTDALRPNWLADRIAAIAALEVALPYVENIAARQPTTQANLLRQRKAADDLATIRAIIAADKKAGS